MIETLFYNLSSPVTALASGALCGIVIAVPLMLVLPFIVKAYMRYANAIMDR